MVFLNFPQKKKKLESSFQGTGVVNNLPNLFSDLTTFFFFPPDKENIKYEKLTNKP